MILADADFFIGLYLKNDAHHQRCVDLIKKIDIKKEIVITTHDVVDDVITKLPILEKTKQLRNFTKHFNKSAST
ncbi:hypothetical protein KC726_01565 [Candidatus Woesebacteria bacterium]|nr:hypothetical protein [Candidatus Woesebacteria bacterium]